MTRILLSKGNLTWNADERRTDRYGSVRLNNDNKPVLVEPKCDELEGKLGRLIAVVIEPVKSPHMGDLFRGFKPSTPEIGEEVSFGEGELFIEHYGQAPHEKGEHEILDDKMSETIKNAFENMGIPVVESPETKPEVYDLIGLKPADGRTTDWLNPKSFYRTHLSKVELYFEPICPPACAGGLTI